MRHKYNKLLELSTGDEKTSIFVRMLLSNLIKNGKVTTTPKRAKVLKAKADSFFSKLFEIQRMNKEEKDAKREMIRLIKATIYGEAEGKKIIEKLLPKYAENKDKSSFVANYKIWFRKGDGAEKIMIKLL